MVFAYGCGFNAHNQIVPPAPSSATPPEDINTFTEITGEDVREARILFAGWSSTVWLLDNTIVLFGHFDERNAGAKKDPLKIKLSSTNIKSPTEIRSVVGDINGPLGLLTWSGKLYNIALDQDSQFSLALFGDESSPTLSHIAISGTGRTTIIMLQARGSRMIHILEFENFKIFQRWYSDPSGSSTSEQASRPFTHHMMGGRALTLLAGATCFILLTEDGDILSWGDGRHSRCLGRTPDATSPADKPALVEALGGIAVGQIDGRGWSFGALSKEGDLYLWGRDKPGSEGSIAHLLGSSDEEVKLLDDERFEDVQDFAIGNGHLLVTTVQGDIYGIGENRSGQLGLGEKASQFQEAWVKVARMQTSQGVQVVAGDASSFVNSSQSMEK